MLLVSSCSGLCPIQWSQMLSWEWRCSWSSTDRRCSNYIWVINNFIAYKGATYIRGFTVVTLPQSIPKRIDLSHKSQNAPVPYPTMHHSVTKMYTCVHISVTKWCIVGYLFDALWEMGLYSLSLVSGVWDMASTLASTFVIGWCKVSIDIGCDCPRRNAVWAHVTGKNFYRFSEASPDGRQVACR